jgi:hypothetical protein
VAPVPGHDDEIASERDRCDPHVCVADREPLSLEMCAQLSVFPRCRFIEREDR